MITIIIIVIIIIFSMLLFVLLLVPGLVPESPRWLLVQGGDKTKLVMKMMRMKMKRMMTMMILIYKIIMVRTGVIIFMTIIIDFYNRSSTLITWSGQWYIEIGWGWEWIEQKWVEGCRRSNPKNNFSKAGLFILSLFRQGGGGFWKSKKLANIVCRQPLKP